MKRRDIYLLIFILALFGFALWSVVPLDREVFGKKGLKLGLDLKGGSQLLYEADLSQKDPSLTDGEAIAAVIEKIQRRVNQYGTFEPVVQKQGEDQILVQLPGVENVTEAISLIGKTALLDFREQKVDESGNQTWVVAKAEGKDGKERELTGKYLKRAHQDVDPYQGPIVAFEWDSEGAYMFGQITQRNLHKPLGIFVDNEMISAPTVQSVITERGQITGHFTLDEAKTLAIQLNSGALDVPLDIIGQQNVDASLGADSIRKSILAAKIGIIALLLFMIIYYRLLGFVACLSLSIYGVLLLSIFKLSGITLTLPGIAGAILSLGMAVDANVLIFERMKEELRAGHTPGSAVEAGFNRAWAAIRDSNITTFIACIVLIWLGGTFAAFMVRGFAITLFIGVALSMFTAIVITRTLLRFIIGSRAKVKLALYGVKT